MTNPATLRDWEKEFCEIDGSIPSVTQKKYINFIRTLLADQQRAMEKNISMLRQWLNEDRIDDPRKMVKNEELEKWLTVKE